MKKIRQLSIILLVFLSQFGKIEAQITSSSINGKITDTKGEVVPGVAVTAIHVPTGSKYVTLADLNGKYFIPNMNPGGPYTIKASFISYKESVHDNITLSLGENQRIDFKLSEGGTELEEVTISASKDDNKTGTGTRIGKEQIQNLPTLSRSLTDFTKLTPQSSNNSFAGTNFRYNNVAIDGAINNDAIGFSPSLGGVGGTSNMPGSSTRSNPISLDAIQDLNVSIAPYDVKLGNFTGGSINAITRSGSNQVTGSVYGFGRNASITGPDNSGDKSKMPSSYQDYQTGFRVGLPIIKDKLFFFTNYENTNRQEPLFYGAGQNGSFMTTAIANQITDSLKSSTFMPKSVYNPNGTYDPGATTTYNIFSKSNKFFARADWNINDKHQLSLRNNYVVSSSSNLDRSATSYQFGNYDFIQNNVNNSTVMELKSRFNSKVANSFIAGFTAIHDYRDPTGAQFPQIQINNVNGTGTVFMGNNREAGIFNMKQKTVEITDNVTIYKGRHVITLGTHNELYQIDYGFINSWNGRFDYNNLSDFLNNKPARMRTIYNLNDDSRTNNYTNPVAKFNVFMMSVYAQDEISLRDNLKVTAGLRIDYTDVPKAPSTSSLTSGANTDANYGTTYTHNSLPSIAGGKVFGQPMFSPRVGFNWDVKKDKKIIVRGGSGIFTGRVPFAWLGYAYYNNGVNYGAFDYKPATPTKINIPTDPTSYQSFNTNVLKQPNRTEVDIIDKNFRLPQIWRSNIAVDLMLPGDYKLTLEGMYTKTINDVIFQQINLKDSVRYNPDDVNHQQPVYLSGGPTGQRADNNFSSVYLITNTHQGYRYSLTAQLSKQYKFGLNFSAAYNYGKSYDMSNGIRNSPESNWQLNQSLSPNNPSLAYSNFDIRHRIVATLGYKKDWNKKLTSYLSFVFTGQSGTPFSWTVNSNKITNNGQQIDLVYIPATQGDINLVAYNDANGNAVTPQQQWTMLDNYISSQKTLNSSRGHFTERNGGRTPWNNRLDMRFMQDFNFYVKERKHTIQLTWDIINLTNMINKTWGYSYFVPDTQNSSAFFGLTPTGTKGANGNPNYTYVTPTTTPWSIDKLASRWQMQIGVRYLF
jgi:hypothetical protein